MRKSMVWIGSVLLMGIAAQLFGAGIDLTGVGARAQALGGNYRGIAQGWSAMHWNPAGLVFNDGLVAGFSLEFITPTVGYTPAKSLAGQTFSATSGNQVENEPKTFLLPSGGVAYNSGNFAFGLGFWAPFGLGSKWDLLQTDGYNSGYPQFEFEDDLQLVDLHPTIAYKISDKFSIGAGASIIFADIMIRKPNFTPNPYIYNAALTSNPLFKNFLAYTLPQDAQTSPYDQLLTDSVLKGDGVGFGGNIGLMFKPSETWSIGLEAKLYSDVPLEGTIDATTYFATHAGAHKAIQPVSKLVFQGMLQKGEIDQETFNVLTNYYSGGSVQRAVALPLKTDLPLPKRIGVGIAYSGINNWLISADAAWTEWSVWDVIELNDENGTKISQLTENWEDGIRAGIGLEYALSSMKLRGGFYSEPAAAISETMTPVIPDAGRRNVVVIGVELPVGAFRIHASYERMFIDDLSVDNWVLTPDQKGYDNMAGFYTMNVNNVMVGFDYSF